MPRVTLPISNGFYVSESLPISNQRCVNFYPNIPQAPSSTQDNLFPTPGLFQLAKLPEFVSPETQRPKCRGGALLDEQPYLVYGPNLFRLDRSPGPPESFEFVQVSTIVMEGVNRCILSKNENQIVIVAPPDEETSGLTYVYDKLADSFNIVGDANFDGPASYVAYVDGFFVFSKADGKKYFHSPLNDARGSTGSGAAYDALDFGLANADPDPIKAIAEHKNQGYIFGSQTVEIVRNIGRVPSTFRRIPGAVVNIGVKAPNTISEYSGQLAFVGGAENDSPAVWLLSGGSKRKLSTTAIDNELSKLSEEDLSNLYSLVYSESGGFFYGIVTPSTSFFHDFANDRWHERQSLLKEGLGRYRVAAMIDAYSRIIIGDNEENIIGQIDQDRNIEYGNIVERFVTSQPFENMGNRTSVAEIEAVVESGVGLSNDVTVSGAPDKFGTVPEITGGSDPQITLAWSDDGGRTFQGFLPKPLGKIGEYNIRPIWRRLGDFQRARVLRLEITSPTDAVILKVEADFG